jgi:hypothetical protein
MVPAGIETYSSCYKRRNAFFADEISGGVQQFRYN